MYGILGALVMRAVFIVAGVALLETFHPIIYAFGAVLAWAAVKMLRGGTHPSPARNRALHAMRRILPATEDLYGQRFVVRDSGRCWPPRCCWL